MPSTFPRKNGKSKQTAVFTSMGADGKIMKKHEEEEDVSRILSRLLAKGRALLAADATDKLRQLESKIAELEAGAKEEKAAAGGMTSPRTDRLLLLLGAFRQNLAVAESTLDKVVARHAQIVSLPETTNPFYEQSWTKKKLGSVFHAVASGGGTGAEIRKLRRSIDEVEDAIGNAHDSMARLEEKGQLPAGRRTAGVPPEKVFGRYADGEAIVAMLHRTVGYEDQEGPGCGPFSVVGVHGAAGCGKTTLAQYVFARVQKAAYFDLAVWVHVRPDSAVADVFADMMEAATGTPYGGGGMGKTVEESLEKELAGKRVFLVLDDVRCVDGTDFRRMERLRRMLLPLHACERGSKVLVTSRTVDALLVLGAAKASCVAVPDLDDDTFFHLFKHYALDGGVDERDRGILEVVAAEIAKKLKKSPLAARIVGEKLCINKRIEFWRSFQDSLPN